MANRSAQAYPSNAPLPNLVSPGSPDWIAEAEALGAAIHRHARSTADGHTVWLDPAHPLDKQGRPVRLGPHLYGGTAGVAFFLAALEQLAQGRGHRELAFRALAPLRHQMSHLVSHPKEAERFQFRLGALNGLGGYIYSFVRIGLWLDEPELIAEACRISTLITPERIGTDPALDVMQGSAGAILALLLLEREAPEPLRTQVRPLERAVACGERLLSLRIGAAGETAAWSVHGHSPWCGFGHGTAGIANALGRLAEATRRKDFRQVALDALAFEDRHYEPEHKNWRDLRSSDLRFMTAWCHGAPGIVLGRLGMLGTIGDPELTQKAMQGLETTRDEPESNLDYLCCGNFGRCEVLLQASLVLDVPLLRQAAEEIAARTIARAQNHGSYRWSHPAVISFTPALFTGAAGIGYTLLRLAAPEQFPCVLVLE